jgi:Skp family chaperone for outer membrane proteins
MKVRILLALILANASLMLQAQEGRFGYIDFNGTLRRMPDYIAAEANLRNIQSEYQDELERSKREF